jgi:hypothetical protein
MQTAVDGSNVAELFIASVLCAKESLGSATRWVIHLQADEARKGGRMLGKGLEERESKFDG